MEIQMFWRRKQQEAVPLFILFGLAETDELNIVTPTMPLLLFFFAQADKTFISWAPYNHRTTPTGPLWVKSTPSEFKGHGYMERAP